MKIYDLMDMAELRSEMDAGFVRVRTHPDEPALRIFGYTEKAQYERHWNNVTTQCRGLIVDGRTQDVLARPFSKFFNYGEFSDRSLNLEVEVNATDKMDGSLGILYPSPTGGHAIATRGSFDSRQARFATEVLGRKYGDFVPHADVTYLFEIIFPENRIVLDYGDLRDIVLLGTRDINGGGYVSASEATMGWPGLIANPLYRGTMRGALALPPRPNAEGMVLEYGDTLIKIKQEDYVRLHKLVTGLSERSVWEHLSAGLPLADLLTPLPDEFRDWAEKVAADLTEGHDFTVARSHEIVRLIVDNLDFVYGEGCWDRRHFAMMAKAEDNPGFLFALLDGVDISPRVWKTLKPRGDVAPTDDKDED